MLNGHQSLDAEHESCVVAHMQDLATGIFVVLGLPLLSPPLCKPICQPSRSKYTTAVCQLQAALIDPHVQVQQSLTVSRSSSPPFLLVGWLLGKHLSLSAG